MKSASDGVYAELPDPVTPLPREKPLPKAKEPTKWFVHYFFLFPPLHSSRGEGRRGNRADIGSGSCLRRRRASRQRLKMASSYMTKKRASGFPNGVIKERTMTTRMIGLLRLMGRKRGERARIGTHGLSVEKRERIGSRRTRGR